MTLRRSFVVPNGAIFCVLVITILGSVNARPVNISNTWILPEEGFPVFYRYFRDRISWYEADAVCQFHHANLVTVDSTAQYDAARAYLKELDIMSNVWIGLIKSNDEGDFTWTDYKPLSGEGYWASAPEEERTPLCTALDPSKDYRWSALSCGGPQIASFICELPVPTWTLKPEGGCLIKSIPSLTVQFLPELAAVQLISDCGLDGTKKVICKSNESHTDILKELACAIPEDDFADNQVTVGDTSSSASISPSHVDTVAFTTTDPGDFSTRIRRETVPTSYPMTSTTDTTQTKTTTRRIQPKPQQTIPVKVISEPLQVLPKTQEEISSSTTKESITQIKSSTPHSEITDESLVSENPTKPSITTTTAFMTTLAPVATTESHNLIKSTSTTIVTKTSAPVTILNTNTEEKLKVKEHHDNIYTVSTDHFIPPLVMAKSKVSTDMTVVSPEEKHMQQKVKYHIQNKHFNVETTDTTKKPDIIVTPDKNIYITTKDPVSTISTSMQKIETPKPKPLVVILVATSTTSVPKTPATKIDETTSATTVITVENAEDKDLLDKVDTLRKPGKGKKYDKYKEEKKKYKDASLLNKQDDFSTKVVAVTIPNGSVKSTPLTVIEITTKATEQPILTTSKENYITATSTTATRTVTKLNSQTETTPSPNEGTTNRITVDKKTLIDPNILELNKGNTDLTNNDSEIIKDDINNKPNTQERKESPEEKPEKVVIANTKTVNKMIKSFTDTLRESDKIEEKIEQTPDPLPRPNRFRILRQPPQQRSFYPYFFNRVLG